MTNPKEEVAELVEFLKDLNGYYIGVPYPLLERMRELIAKHEANILDNCPECAALAASDWQPIETAPKDGTMILLGDSKSRCGPYVGWWRGGDYPWAFVDDPGPATDPNDDDAYVGRVEVNGYRADSPPTHWMPMPKGPSARTAAE